MTTKWTELPRISGSFVVNLLMEYISASSWVNAKFLDVIELRTDGDVQALHQQIVMR